MSAKTNDGISTPFLVLEIDEILFFVCGALPIICDGKKEPGAHGHALGTIPFSCHGHQMEMSFGGPYMHFISFITNTKYMNPAR